MSASLWCSSNRRLTVCCCIWASMHAIYGQHVGSIHLPATCHCKNKASLHELPDCLCRLECLKASSMCLQLQPGNGYQSVLHARMPLQQLQLDNCELLDGEQGLAAALLLLPWLQHLSVTEGTSVDDCDLVVSSEAVQGLHQLTYLELVYGMLHDGHRLDHLSGLQDLRLLFDDRLNIDTDMLPSPQQLTRSQLRYVEREVLVPPAVLAGRTSLRHLEVDCTIDGGSAGVTELLSHLPQLQQLTHPSLDCSLTAIAPAAAYSARSRR